METTSEFIGEYNEEENDGYDEIADPSFNVFNYMNEEY